MLGSPNVPHNKSHRNASELDADLWLDRARDLCGHREELVTQLRSLGVQLQTASGEEAALLRPKSHGLLRELREAACHVCEAAQQYRDAARDQGAPLHYKEEDYLEKMTHDLDFMGESEPLVAAIGTPRRLLRNNPLMLPRSLRAAELEATDAPPKNAEQARLRRAEDLLVGVAVARRNPKAPSAVEALIEERADALDILSPPQTHYDTTRASPQHPERVFNRPLPGEEVGLRPQIDAAPPPRERTPEAPRPTFANKAPAVNDDWVREAHAQLEALREANANLPLERGDPELAALNHNPALEKFRPVRVPVVLFIKMAWGRRLLSAQVLEPKKVHQTAAQRKKSILNTEGAYADPDARSYAPPRRRPKGNRHRNQLVDRLGRLQRHEGPLLPDITPSGPPPGLKKMKTRKARPLQGVTLARAELSAMDLTADDLEDISTLDAAPSESARRVGACALTLVCRGDRCPPDASWAALIHAFDGDPDGMMRTIRNVDARVDVPPFKARALSRLLSGGAGLNETVRFGAETECGAALGRLAAWCSRIVCAALRAAERAGDSAEKRRDDDSSTESDVSSLATTPRGLIKRRARRRKKKVPPVVRPSVVGNVAPFRNGRVLAASWWRFEASGTACLVSVVAPAKARVNSHALMVKAYDPTRGDGESILVLDAPCVDRLRNHHTLENFVRTQGLLRKLELRFFGGTTKLRERAGPPTGASASPPGGGPRVLGAPRGRARQAASAPVSEASAIPPRAIETAPPARAAEPAPPKPSAAERRAARLAEAEAQRMAQEQAEKRAAAKVRLEKAARAEAKRIMAAEAAAEEARRERAATAAAVVLVQAAWRCRVGARALGVARGSTVALQAALRGRSGREAAVKRRVAREQAKRDAERRMREDERRATEARRLDAEKAEAARRATEAKQVAAEAEARRAEDYAAAKAREAAKLLAQREYKARMLAETAEADRRAADAARRRLEEREAADAARRREAQAQAEAAAEADREARAARRRDAAAATIHEEREARALVEHKASPTRRRDEAARWHDEAVLSPEREMFLRNMAEDSDDGYGDDGFDEFSPAKTTGPSPSNQRRPPVVPPVPLDTSESDDGYADSDFDDDLEDE